MPVGRILVRPTQGYNMNGAHAARVFALIVALLVWSWAPPAFACDCNVKQVGDALDLADFVVSGIVTSIRLARVDQFGREAPTVVEIAIQRTWKGKAVPAMTLHTQRKQFFVRRLRVCRGRSIPGVCDAKQRGAHSPVRAAGDVRDLWRDIMRRHDQQSRSGHP